MSSEKIKADVSGTHSSNNQVTVTERSSNTKSTANSHLEREVAQRAIFGFNRRRFGGKKVRNNDARSLPSRLSKVSLADDAEN